MPIVTRSRALLLVLATTAAACSSKPSADQASATAVRDPRGVLTIPPASPLRSRLVFDTARIIERSEAVVATASVESDPARTVRILPPFAGRVVALHVRLGDAVAVGDSLLTLASPDFTAAQADYSRARSAFRQASNTLARQHELAQYGIAAQRDVDQAETDFAQAQGDLRRTVARLAQLGLDTSVALGEQSLVVRSPIAGRVIDLSVGAGEFHNDPNAPLMTVADLASVYLAANVPEKDVHAIQPGERALAVVSAYPSDTLRGIVAMVGAVVDTATRTTKARVQLPNPAGRLKPGMYGTILFAAHPRPTVVVPTTALLQVGDSNFVFVETQPWTLERRGVVVGDVEAGRATILTGLAGGERVVARQVVLLQ